MKKFNPFFLATLLLMLTFLHGTQAQRKYIVNVTLKNGTNLRGILIRPTADSLMLSNTRTWQPIGIAASDIKSIRIRKKKSVWLGLVIGGSVGATLGAIIGAVSYKPSDCSSQSSGVLCGAFDPLDQIYSTAGGFAIGALAGSLFGMAAGSSSKEFKVEGDQSHFNFFANAYQ